MKFLEISLKKKQGQEWQWNIPQMIKRFFEMLIFILILIFFFRVNDMNKQKPKCTMLFYHVIQFYKSS